MSSALDSIDGLRSHLPDENVLRESDMSASSTEDSPRHRHHQHDVPVAAPDAPPALANPRVRFAQSHAPPAAPSSSGNVAGGSSRTMIAMLQRYGYDLEDLDGAADSDNLATNSAGILHLRERKNNQTAFHIAVKKGHVDVLKALMKLPRAEEFVNVGDKHGNTPLHFVASKDNSTATAAELQTSLGTLLLSMGANLHATNVRGQTPLEVHIMTAKADTSVFVKLISFRGMQLNNLVGNGTTYLHMAIVDRAYPEMAGALVNAGASINIPDHNGVMVSDVISRQTLVRLTKYMREGTQAPPADVPRSSCKLCKNPKSLLDALRDCHVCGRTMCRNCSKKLGDIKDPEQATREKLDKDALAVRLCATCCTVTQLRDRKVAEQKKFAESLFGMNRV